jgi:hypothetical protein
MRLLFYMLCLVKQMGTGKSREPVYQVLDKHRTGGEVAVIPAQHASCAAQEPNILPEKRKEFWDLSSNR